MRFLKTSIRFKILSSRPVNFHKVGFDDDFPEAYHTGYQTGKAYHINGGN